MANDHVIDVKVRADTTGLSKGLHDASSELDKAKGGFSKYGDAADGAGKATQGFAEKNKAHLEAVGQGAMIMGGAVLAGVAVAIHAYSDFAGRMAQVQSLSHASAGEMDVLAKSALTMGSAFGLSANDVADAEIELVKAGISVKDMIGGALPGALALAAAGQIDVGKATEIATIALTQFNLHGKDVPHVADLLAAGADKALGGVSELGDGLKQGGLVASQFGLTIDDTVGTLSAFANAGLLGSDAGTSMKTMFLSLASPSKQAQAALDQYNITAYDSRGQFIGITALAGQLHDKLGNLSDAQRNAALSTIFGTDAMRSASVLMKEGSEGMKTWIKDVNDQGFAAAQAAGKLNSLNGDFKKLQAAAETGLIQMGAASDGFLRPIVKGITDAIQAFNSMDPAGKGLIMSLAAITGGGALLVGMLLTAIPKIYESAKAIEALRTAASPAVSSALNGIAKAAVAVGVGIAAMAATASINNAFMPVTKGAEDTTQALLKMQNTGVQSVDDLFKSFNDQGRAAGGIDGVGAALQRVNNMQWNDNLNKFGNDVFHIEDQLKPARDQIDKLDGSLANLVGSGNAELASNSFLKIKVAAERQGVSLETAAKSFPQYLESLQKLANDMKVPITQQELLNWSLGKVPQGMLDAQKSTEGQAKAAEIAAQHTAEQKKALDDLGLGADGATVHLDKLVTSMINSGLITLSARDAARNFEASIDALDESIKKNGTTLDITTAKGRENQAAFDGISGAGLKSAEAMAKNGESQENVQKNLRGTYDALIAAAGKFGITGGAADDMARQVMGIPKDVPIDTSIKNYADSMAKLEGIKQKVDYLNGKQVSVNVQYTESGTAVLDRASDAGNSKMVKASATGGAVNGPGPKGVDSERYLLAPGEHVLTDQDVDAMGGQSAVYAFRNQLHNGGGAQRPLYATAAPSQAWAPVAATQSAGSVNANFIINQVDDPLGTSHAVVRRMSALAS